MYDFTRIDRLNRVIEMHHDYFDYIAPVIGSQCVTALHPYIMKCIDDVDADALELLMKQLKLLIHRLQWVADQKNKKVWNIPHPFIFSTILKV